MASYDLNNIIDIDKLEVDKWHRVSFYLKVPSDAPDTIDVHLPLFGMIDDAELNDMIDTAYAAENNEHSLVD